jgi:hypothetical protein
MVTIAPAGMTCHATRHRERKNHILNRVLVYPAWPPPADLHFELRSLLLNEPFCLKTLLANEMRPAPLGWSLK